jgi:hypothetical protein
VQAVALFDWFGLPLALGDPAVAQVAAEVVLDALAALLGHDRPGAKPA